MLFLENGSCCSDAPGLSLAFDQLSELSSCLLPWSDSGQPLLVDISIVGDGSGGSSVVQCHTDLSTCCSGVQGPHRGDWYFPDGTTRLPFSGRGVGFFEWHRAQRVDLRRRNNAHTLVGIYRCDIPTKAKVKMALVIMPLLCLLWHIVNCQIFPYVSFSGQILANHSYVDLSLLGSDYSGSDSVQCHTDLVTCCSHSQGSHRGDWYFPDGHCHSLEILLRIVELGELTYFV